MNHMELKDMVRVHCVAETDTEKWPTYLCCRPIVGDFIYSASNKRGVIIEVAHISDDDRYSSGLQLTLDTKRV